MRSKFWVYYFVFVAGLLWATSSFVSCRKKDINVEKGNDVSLAEMKYRFFSSNRSSDETEKLLVDYIRRKDDSLQFLEKTVGQIGYPYWDRAFATSAVTTNVAGGDSTSFIYVPFVRESQFFVNAAMVIRITDNDTSISYLCDWQFAQLPATSSGIIDIAEKHALFFMTMDRMVFDRSNFVVTDTTLFNTGQYRADSINIEIMQASVMNGQSAMASGPICIDAKLSLLYCTQCPGNTTVSQCWEDYYGVTSGTGGLPPSPGTGGGGSGTGWTSTPTPFISFFGIESVTNGFTNPCIVAAKNKLPDFNLNIFANSLYLAQLSQTYNWKIVFEENRNLVDNTGNPAIAESYAVTPNKEWHVALNPLFWEQATQPNATQEIAGLNILHEIIHGFIRIYKDHFNLTTLNTFTTHEVMFKNCIDAMVLILKSSFGMSDTDARALAIQGLDDVLQKQYSAAGTLSAYNTEYNQFAITNYQISIPAAELIFDQYIAGTKGTKCF